MIEAVSLKRWLVLVSLFALAQNAEAGNDKLRLVDFDDPAVIRQIGVWEHNVLDPDQSLKIAIIPGSRTHERGGTVLRLGFDVDSPNPAMVGFWAKLEASDLSGFDTLHLSLKSDEERSFTGSIALQFTDEENRKASYLISGIKREWTEFRVPLKRFPRIRDWSRMKEFEIVIDDMHAVPKEGILFVGEIFVTKGGAFGDKP